MFVDVLLIAYPLALLASILGTVVLICLRARARSRQHREAAAGLAEKSIAGAPAPALRVDRAEPRRIRGRGRPVAIEVAPEPRLVGGRAAARIVCVKDDLRADRTKLRSARARVV